MTIKTLALVGTLLVSVFLGAESQADEKRDRLKQELLARPVFQNNLTPEAHLKSGSVPPVEASVAANARPTGEQVEPRTPASEVATEQTALTQDGTQGGVEVRAPEEQVMRQPSSTSNPLLWILPLLGLIAGSFYVVKRRK